MTRYRDLIHKFCKNVLTVPAFQAVTIGEGVFSSKYKVHRGSCNAVVNRLVFHSITLSLLINYDHCIGVVRNPF